MPIRITIDIFSGKPNPAGAPATLRNKKSILFSAFLLSLSLALTLNTSAQQDKRAEAQKLLMEGLALFQQGTAESLRAAFTKFNESRELAHSTDYKEAEAQSLVGMGRIANDLGEKQKALDYYNQALPLWNAVGDKSSEAKTLNNIGAVYSDLGEKQKALDYYNQALPLLKAVGDKSGEAKTLNNIGGVYDDLGGKQKALEYYNQALPLRKAVGDKAGEATTLSNIGAVYDDLGEKQKALGYYDQALLLRKAAGDKTSEAKTLNNIGRVYSALGEKQKALDYYNQALPLRKAAGDKSGEATSLNNIGAVYDALGEKQKALGYYNQALPLRKAVGDKSGEATTLNNIGLVYHALGEKQKALDYYNQALPLRKAVGDKSGEATTLNNMMYVWSDLNSPRFAVFYGKQSVNTYQRLRGNISGLDQALQKTYMQSVEDTYRNLANILIAQGRIPEAEQVLAMLKEEEYFAYLQRDDSVAKGLLRTASLTPEEAESIKRFNELADRITAIGKDYGELFQERRNPEYEDKAFPKQARLDELKRALDDATSTFTRFLEDLKITFGKEDKRVAEIESGLQSMLKSMNTKHTAIVSTIVGEDRLNIFVTTADTQRAHTIDIKAANVNKLVADFRAAVTSPNVDPHNSGKKLYDVLVGPIEKDLAGIRADTIVWSLDGTLRYAPVAALWDGQGYLVQRYSNVIITLASQKNLEKEITDKSFWRALGVGVSKEYENFLALSAVPDELDCIITDQGLKAVSVNPKCPSGVVIGKKLIDERFTKEAFKDALGRDYRLLHVASHFSLQPGDDKNSFLLLGGGTDRKLSVNEINQSMFNGVELLTLSACNTAVGTEKSNGVEVEGFSAVAQNQGAKAVIATLWAVADPSTRDFMVQFYTLYASNRSLNKAEALRQSQLSLLQEKDVAPTNNQEENRSQTVVTGSDNANALKAFRKDPKKPYAHPYYWAPFILIGNWK
jgi:CHAT domain-containing protein/tetratricopeptide (TPR) repeat protein